MYEVRTEIILSIEEERSKPFETNIIDFAKKDQFLLLTTDVLFNIYRKFLEKKLDLSDFIKILKNEVGIYNN